MAGKDEYQRFPDANGALEDGRVDDGAAPKLNKTHLKMLFVGGMVALGVVAFILVKSFSSSPTVGAAQEGTSFGLVAASEFPFPAGDGTIAVLYKNAAWSGATPYFHVNADNKGWTTVPGKAMTALSASGTLAAYNGYYYATVSGSSAVFVFNKNGGQAWDTRDGSNYKVSASGVYAVANSVITTITTYGSGSNTPVQSCPGSPACSGHGSCSTTTYTCSCYSGYSGSDCSTVSVTPVTPKTCPGSPACSGHGNCDTTTGTCSCYTGYTGSSCSSSSGGSSTNSSTSNSAHYKTNPSGQVGKYKTDMKVSCTSTKSDGFSDWSADLLIAQGAANDDAKSFYGGHEYPSYDSYSLYAAWDDSNLYLGWQFVYVNDVANPSNNGGNEAKPTNGDIPQMLVFDTDPAKATIGTQASGHNVWYDSNPTGFNFDQSLGVDKLAMFSSKGGVGSPALFSMNAAGFLDYTAANCQLFKQIGVVYGAVDGLLPSQVWGVKKYPYVPADLDGTEGWIDFLAAGHNKAYDQFYEMKIPFTALGITRSILETRGIGVMHVSIYGTSGVNSLPFDSKATLDNAMKSYSQDSSTSKEKEDLDVFTVPLARIGKL